jgi:hypothetical protein
MRNKFDLFGIKQPKKILLKAIWKENEQEIAIQESLAALLFEKNNGNFIMRNRDFNKELHKNYKRKMLR